MRFFLRLPVNSLKGVDFDKEGSSLSFESLFSVLVKVGAANRNNMKISQFF